MNFYPNRLQWILIWGIALAALWMWIDGSTPLQAHDRRVVALVAIGVLIVWMVSDVERLREVLDWYEPYGTRRAEKKQTLVIGLGVVLVLVVTMLLGWWLPDVGPKPQPAVSPTGYHFGD